VTDRCRVVDMCLCLYAAGADSDSTVTVNCTCLPGFVGDGFVCNANTWLALSELPAAKLFYRVITISLHCDISVCVTTGISKYSECEYDRRPTIRHFCRRSILGRIECKTRIVRPIATIYHVAWCWCISLYVMCLPALCKNG